MTGLALLEKAGQANTVKAATPCTSRVRGSLSVMRVFAARAGVSGNEKALHCGGLVTLSFIGAAASYMDGRLRCVCAQSLAQLYPCIGNVKPFC